MLCPLNHSFVYSHEINDFLLGQSISQVQRCCKILNSDKCLGKILNKEVKRFTENDFLLIVKGNIHFVLSISVLPGIKYLV